MTDSKRPASGNLLPVGCLLLTATISTLTIYWLEHMQTTVNEISEAIAEQENISTQPPSFIELVERSVKNDTDEDGSLDGHLMKIATSQVVLILLPKCCHSRSITFCRI
jgi:hypothetical protein